VVDYVAGGHSEDRDMASNPVTVTLDHEFARRAERYVASGEYESVSEVVEEGLRALDREQAAYNEYVGVKVAEALADPRPALPLAEAMAQIRAGIRREPE
jgi:antitoxin ParD1/3/4